MARYPRTWFVFNDSMETIYTSDGFRVIPVEILSQQQEDTTTAVQTTVVRRSYLRSGTLTQAVGAVPRRAKEAQGAKKGDKAIRRSDEVTTKNGSEWFANSMELPFVN